MYRGRVHGRARAPVVCTVQEQDTGGEVGCCPPQRALHPLFPTPGHEEVLVTGESEQLQRPRIGRGHNYLLHDVLQKEEVMMVSALPGRTSGQGSSLRCRQMVAAENEGQCFRLNVLYDWGATVSMISEEAVEVMGLATAKQAKRIIKA